MPYNKIGKIHLPPASHEYEPAVRPSLAILWTKQPIKKPAFLFFFEQKKWTKCDSHLFKSFFPADTSAVMYLPSGCKKKKNNLHERWKTA